MGDKKNLIAKDANLKIKELAEEIKSCMFCTYKVTDGLEKLTSRPMSTQQVDTDGNVWFLSDKRSHKNSEIQMNSKVDLLYAHGQDKYLSLHGIASLSYDKDKIKELWAPIAKVWFTQGENDPNISVIKVTVKDGYYWDTKHGKMVQLVKMGVALLTGQTMDDGIEGKLAK